MDKKRLIFIGIFAVAVIGIGYLMYAVFLKKSPTPLDTTPKDTTIDTNNLPTSGSFTQSGTTGSTQTGTGTTGGGNIVSPSALPESGIRKVSKVIEENIISPKINSNGNVNFYNSIDGKFYTSSNGQISEMSDQVFFNVENVIWSGMKNESIIEYPDGSNIYYNFDTKVQKTLPKHWEEFSFSSQDDQIVAKSIGLSPENRWLVSSNADGSNVTLIEPLGENADKVIVDWSPNKQIVGISLAGGAVGVDRQEVFFVGQNGENFKSLIVEGRGFESTWSPSGDKLLYSVYSSRSEYKPELWIVDSNVGNIGANRKMLGTNTWANKCTFGNERNIYCAVPNSLPVGSGFSPELANTVNYTLVRIDTQTGLQAPLQMEEIHSIDKIFLSEDGGTLYFTDKFEAGLFSISI